jgi:hypothetical protein
MTRKLMAALFIAGAAFLLTVRADDPAAKADAKKPDVPAVDPSREDVAAKEKLLRENFEAFKTDLLNLREVLSTSDKDEDKATVKVLDKVIEALKKPTKDPNSKDDKEYTVDQKFADVLKVLDDPDAFRVFQKAEQVQNNNRQLHEALLSLIELLRNGDELKLKHQAIEENMKLLERLKEIRSQQERNIARIERQQENGKDLAKSQQKISDQINKILDPNAKETKPDFKKSEAKYDNKPGSDARGEAKNDTQAPKGDAKDDKAGDNKENKPGADKSGENKDGMKPGDGKEGDNRDGMKPSDAKGGENKDGMKPGESKDGDKSGENKDAGKPGENKDNKGDNKDAKAGESKDAGKPGDGASKENKPGENKDGKGGDKSGDGKEGPKQQGKPSDGKGGDNKDGMKPGDGKEGDKSGAKDGDGKSGESKEGAKSGESKDGKGGESKDGKAGDGKQGSQSENKPSDGKGGESKDGKPGEGKEASKADPNSQPGGVKSGAGDNPKPGDMKPGQGKEAGKPGDGKAGEPKPGDGQANSKPGEGKGNEAKPATGSEPGKPGSGKTGTPGDGKTGKPGDAKEGKPSDGKAGGDPKAGDAKSGQPGGAKSGDGKPSESKSGSDNKGQSDGKGESKPGDPKSGMNPESKPSDSKGNPSAGQPNQGQPSQGKGDSPSGGDSGAQPPPPPQGPQPHIPVRKQIEDGAKDSQETKQKLDEEDKPGALPKANQTAEDINKAMKKLEEIINQDRQEEIDRILERLQARCARMLAMQIAVRDGTVKLDEKVVEVRRNKGDERAVAQDANVLSDNEYEIVKEADRALALLENDGTAVAFAEMFQMVRKDMLTVKDRLGQTDTGTVTVAVENEIIKNLGDMVEALKKQREINKQKGQQQQQPGKPKQKQPGEDPLVDIIAQLRLLRSMQKGLNDRTELYSKEYPGEQAPAPIEAKSEKEKQHHEMIQKEMRDLADTEAKISKILKDMLTGKNKVD